MPDALRTAVATFWEWIPVLALQGAVVLLVAAVIDRLLPPSTPPALRELLWGLALLRLVLPPWVASPLGLVPATVGWLPAGLASPGTPSDADAAMVDPMRWATAIAALWLAGIVVVLLAGAWRWRRIDAALARQRTAAEGDDLAALARAGERLGLRRLPALYRLSTTGPFVVAGRHPAIYLPADPADAGGSGELEHVLLHELAHLARRDAWRRGLAAAVQVVYWFHPLLPYARRRLAAAGEAGCDRLVARALGAEGAAAYRRTLLAVLARALAPAPAGAGFLAPPTVLRLRLAAIAHADRDRPWPRRLAGTGLTLLLLVVMLPAARRGEAAARDVAARIARPPGCLQLRYLVMRELAREAGHPVPPIPSSGDPE